MKAFRVSGLIKRYGAKLALDHVSMDLEWGQVGCLVGPNGAGKTTLIECLLGLRDPDEGEIELLGHRVRGPLPPALARRVGPLLEEAHLHPWVPVASSLAMIAELYGCALSRERMAELLRQVGLEPEVASRPYGQLSYGQRRKVDLAAALVTEPDFLVLDDPFAGVDPIARIEILNTLRQLRAGRTIFYATHLLDVAARFADRVYVLIGGRVRAVGAPAELIRRYGGAWRIRAVVSGPTVPEGFRRDASGSLEATASGVQELAERIEALLRFSDVFEVSVDPPDLYRVFEHLVQEEM